MYAGDLFDFINGDRKTVDEVAPASSVTLRPYQNDAVDRVFDEWSQGNNATLVCLPTGCGKSVVFSEVMRRICTEQ